MKRGLMFLAVILLLCGCGAVETERDESERKKSNYYDEAEEVSELMGWLKGTKDSQDAFAEKEQGKTTEKVLESEKEKSEEIVNDDFIPDYKPGEINKEGNSSANLCQGGDFSITGQGEWTYYAKEKEIKKIDGGGNVYSVHYAENNVRNLNVIGDWLYYCSYSNGGEIHKVRTDGSRHEKIIENMCYGPDFRVVGNYIYYVKEEQLSATSHKYNICKYDLNTGEVEQASWNVGSGVQFVGITGDDFYFIEQNSNENNIQKFDANTLELDEKVNGPIFGCGFIYNDHLMVYSDKSHLFDIGSGVAYDYDLSTGAPVWFATYYRDDIYNADEDNLIWVERTLGKNYGITYSTMKYLSDVEIIKEASEMMYRIWVVGDWAYYTLDFGALYRVSLDGENWMELP